jgi:hypothetical protein
MVAAVAAATTVIDAIATDEDAEDSIVSDAPTSAASITAVSLDELFEMEAPHTSPGV